MNDTNVVTENTFFWKMERAFENLRLVFYHFRDEWYLQPILKAAFVVQFPGTGLCQTAWFPNEKHNNHTGRHKDGTTLTGSWQLFFIFEEPKI
jgi:hypothetical protein